MPTRWSILLGGAATALLGSAATVAADPGDLDLRSTLQPEPSPSWFVHAGVGAIILSESASMWALDVPLPGATIQIDSQVTAVFEIGYFVTPNVAISLTGGVPPNIDIRADGSIGTVGTLGAAVYGPATVTAHYHFRNFGSVQPYVGAGLAYMKIFDTEDKALSSLAIDDTFGPAVQAGVDLMLNERWGAFIDVKKAWLTTDATGQLGGVPVRGEVVLDPLVVHGGLTFRF